jgi:hypothetical protein
MSSKLLIFGSEAYRKAKDNTEEMNNENFITWVIFEGTKWTRLSEECR